ncbi:hypothetical protein [Streptomyces sp. NPDC057682]|uniref:BACON domain-containing protein n=1 Tax=Streptomyces sp. NPDC057682 TaxID=3346210 RepID=UPI003695B288
MTSSRLETPANTPGAHRAPRRAPHASPKRPPARYEPHLDGLFTYCLSVLCDHDAATEALGAVLALAERQGGRCPTGEEERRTWLYALARWMCLRRLAERKQGRRAHRGPDPARAHGQPSPAGDDHRGPVAHPGRRGRRTAASARAPKPPVTTPAPRSSPASPPPSESAGASQARSEPPAAPSPWSESPAAAEAHRRELARLAWPEAAGTTPEQREALELAVRHRLAPRAVAAVLGLEPATARELLAAAACEVERTRAALAVAETGTCPAVGRLTGDRMLLLSAPLRRELVRHVDDCPRCRRAAERADARGPWPGAAITPAAALAVVEAPRPSAYVAMLQAQKHQKNRSATPRFDRTGFPMDPKDHAARRDRLRSRVMTTTVVATVVAAPVIALWSAYRGAPLTGEGHEGPVVTATDNDERSTEAPYGHYENAGNARPEKSRPFTDGDGLPEVSAEVIGAESDPDGDGRERRTGRLTVEARSSGGTTTLTLTASASGPVAWTAGTAQSWLRLSATSGRLAPGASTTVRVLVDHVREPAGYWTARIAVAPSGAVVALHGYGGAAPSVPPPSPSGPSRPHPPVPQEPSSPDPDPTPTPTPTPDPTGSTPPPTDPGSPSPSPDPTAPPSTSEPGKGGPGTPPRAD